MDAKKTQQLSDPTKSIPRTPVEGGKAAWMNGRGGSVRISMVDDLRVFVSPFLKGPKPFRSGSETLFDPFLNRRGVAERAQNKSQKALNVSKRNRTVPTSTVASE